MVVIIVQTESGIDLCWSLHEHTAWVSVSSLACSVLGVKSYCSSLVKLNHC